MVFIAAIGSVSILLFGAAFHVYWGLGGRVGYEASIPRRATGERLFSPPNWGAHLVGFVLVVASWLVLVAAQVVAAPIPRSLAQTAVLCMSVGFFVRSIWCSPYAGLLKTVRNSAFAHYDTMLYSPLLLLLAAGLFYVQRQP